MNRSVGSRKGARLSGGNNSVDNRAGPVSDLANAERGSDTGDRIGRRSENAVAQSSSRGGRTSQRRKQVRKPLQQLQVGPEHSNTLESYSSDENDPMETVVGGLHSPSSSNDPSSQGVPVSSISSEDSAKPFSEVTPASSTSSALPSSPTTSSSFVTPNVHLQSSDANLLPSEHVPGSSIAENKEADVPKSSKVTGNSRAREPNPSNQQEMNRKQVEERRAMMKLRDEDAIMENTYPMKAAKHVIRRSTPDDEEEPQCLICGKGPSRYRPLLQCQGIMNGHVHGNEEDPEKKSFEDRCECVFHIDCLKNHNAGDFNLQYSVRAECQGKLQCSLHCCEKCNLERHKQSAYQGDIIECDLCYRAFHSVSCLPAGCEVITKEIDGHKYRRIICDAHSSDETTPGEHIEVCSALECKITEKDKESIQLQKCKTCVRSFHVECKIAQDPKLIPNFSKRCDFCVLDDTMRINTPVIAFCPSIRKFHLGTISDWNSLPASKQPREKRGKMLVKWERKNLPSVPEFLTIPVQFGAELIQSYCKRFENDFNGRAEEMLNEHKKRVSENRPNFCKVVAKEGTHCRKFNFKSKEVKEIVSGLQTVCSSSCNGNCLDSSCDNFSSGRECPDKCKKECRNKQLRNGEVSSKIETRPTASKGFGVFCTSDVAAGEHFALYVGELIDEKEKARRQKVVRESKDFQGNLYMMKQGAKGLTVDAAAYGNIARYFNHSCEPNAKCVKKQMWLSRAGEDHFYVDRFYIKATIDIKTGEEITFAYGMEDADYLTTCHCESKKCTKIMGKAQNEQEPRDSPSASQEKDIVPYYRSFPVDRAPSCLLLQSVNMSGFINTSLNLLFRITPFREWILTTPNDGAWISALRKVFDKTSNDAVEVRKLMAPIFHNKKVRHDAADAIENIIDSLRAEQMINGGIPSLSGYKMTESCSTPNCMKTPRNESNGIVTNIFAESNDSLQTLIDKAYPATLQCSSCGHGEISKRYEWTSDDEYHIISLMREATQKLVGTFGSDIVSLFGAQWNIVGIIQLQRGHNAYIRDGDDFFCVNDSKLHKSRTHADIMQIAGCGVSSILLKRNPVERMATSSGDASFSGAANDERKDGKHQDSVDARGKRRIEETIQHTEDQQPEKKKQKTSADPERQSSV